MESKVGWAGKVRRSRHIGDFRTWQDKAAYEKAFARLLKALQVRE